LLIFFVYIDNVDSKGNAWMNYTAELLIHKCIARNWVRGGMPMQFPVQVLDVVKTPIMFFNTDGSFLYANHAAHAILPGRPEEWKWPAIADTLPKEFMYQLHEFATEHWQGVVIECTPLEQSALQNEIYRLQLRNKELEDIVDASSDELFVTDGEGRILYVSGDVEDLYNIPKADLIGKSVFDLERERVFYPSVIALVLRDKQRHTILQSTRHGRLLAVTGNPVFDEEGRITRVISAAIDMRALPRVYSSAHSRIRVDLQNQHAQRKPLSSGTSSFVASSAQMQSLMNYCRRVAATDATVLLLGETGVGKNRLARYIHEHSRRSRGPFVEVNCAALPESLIESELFGYERGAFTGSNREGKTGKVEVANGGTLFLNEIGELPLQVQAKLLDFVQDHQFSRVGGVRTITVDVRIIAATNRNLEEMVQNKSFRKDLYYRLNVVPIHIPALRQRMDDLEALCDVILSQVARRHGLPVKRLHPATVSLLQQYDWPGNVRELENLLERLCISIEEGLILPGHLPEYIRVPCRRSEDTPRPGATDSEDTIPGTGPGPFRLRDALQRYEARLLADALARYKTTYAIARALDISQPTVVRKLKQYGLTRD
jgi:PAS domain S-box-containing protein